MPAGATIEANLLLRLLPRDALERAAAHEQHHDLRDRIIEPEETPAFVYFPHPGAVCSIVRSTSDGQMVETGVVGGEGVFNVQSVLTTPAPTGSAAVIQHEGRFTRMESAVARALFDQHAAFREGVLAYTSLFLDQVTQNLVCNRLHVIEQRLAKWLLVMRDRVAGDELHLTQEFLSYMLGVRRPGVTIAVSALEADGLIEHGRNRIQLRDLDGIASRSCECYLPLRDKLAAFIDRVG